MSVGISTACFYPAATEEALRCVAEAGAKVTEVFFLTRRRNWSRIFSAAFRL